MTRTMMLAFLLFCVIAVSRAQDIESKLSGNTSAQGFTVKSNAGTPLWTIRGNGKVGIASSTPEFTLTLAADGGILAEGQTSHGSMLATNGTGTRLIWYPRKAAFRAGYAFGDVWDDANIGSYSVAMGCQPEASGYGSTALGNGAVASGSGSTALGPHAIASGQNSSALGESTASGINAIALGWYCVASGDHSTAMGKHASTGGYEGAFVIGDRSTTTLVGAQAANQYAARFAGGYRLYTNAAMSLGVYISASGTSWGSISDSTKKCRYNPADAEAMLSRFAALRLGSWNYTADPSPWQRHYGPMAQEWFAAFGRDGVGVIGDDTTLASADVDGVLCIAIKALEQRTAELKEKTNEIAVLSAKIARLESQVHSIADMQTRLAKLESQQPRHHDAADQKQVSMRTRR